MTKASCLVGLDVRPRQTRAAILHLGSGEVVVSRLRVTPAEVLSFLERLPNTRWQAVLEAALDADDSLIGVPDWAKAIQASNHIASSTWPSTRLQTWRCGGSFAGNIPSSTMRSPPFSQAVTSMSFVPQRQRSAQTALAVRKLLVDPVLSSRVLVAGPPFSDPYRHRMEIADLAIDVVTALDYLSANLGRAETRSSESFSLSESVDRLPARDAEDRRRRRALDARAAATRLAGRLLASIRQDFSL